MNTEQSQSIFPVVTQEVAKPILQATLKDGLIPAIDIVAVPNGYKLESLQKFVEDNLQKPPRRKGTSVHATISSLVSHIRRYKSPDTVLFADEKSTTITAVYNYNPAGDDQFNAFHADHRAKLELLKSEELQEWSDFCEEPKTAEQLAFFLEKRGIDLISESDAPESHRPRIDNIKKVGGLIGTPHDVIKNIPALKILETSTVQNVSNIGTGECSFVYTTDHTTHNEKGETMTVPGWFLIAIPLFKKGPLDLIPVRLRYRKKGGAIFWSCDLLDITKYIEESYEDIVQKIAEGCELAAFNGKPE